MSEDTTTTMIMGLATKPAIAGHICGARVYTADKWNMSGARRRRKHRKGIAKASSASDVGLDVGQLA